MVLIAPEGIATRAGLVPRMRRFEVTGLFHSGMYQYDRGLALINLTDASRLFGLGSGEVTGMRLKIDDPWQAPRGVRNVAYALKLRRTPSSRTAGRVSELLELVGLAGYEIDMTGPQLKKMYRDRKDYQTRVARRYDEVTKQGWALPVYRDIVLADAAAIAF